jgi:RNA 3'-terminal phosphate cyclase (ATP)
MNMIEIDGSIGEGGGQVLRTALSLSCITRHPLRLFNIRRGRKRPGLMPQHVTSVNAAAGISSAEVSGNEKGSSELEFIPGKIRPGEYFFDITTAGSCSLVIQTLIPPLIFADGVSRIKIRGGTHVPFSPSYDYIAEVFLQMLERLGIRVESEIKKYGFYPKGGGEAIFRIFPAERIRGLKLLAREELLNLHGYAGVSRLPVSIAERQKRSVMNILPYMNDLKIVEAPSAGEGTFVFLKAEYGNTLAGFTSLGKRGKPAEKVGKEAAEDFCDFHAARACLDPWLADQLLIYLSLATERSEFTASRITQHLTTNLLIIKRFLDIRYEIEKETNKVTIEPER